MKYNLSKIMKNAWAMRKNSFLPAGQLKKWRNRDGRE